jgi:glycerate kinase
VVAPDKFKGSLTAAEAADALATGLLAVRPDLEIVLLPVADGGDGTLAAAVSAGYELVPVVAEGPVGALVETAFALRGGAAVVELADVTGLRRLPGPPAPLTASTYGVGQVIAAALAHGATRIMLGIGGSASTDGGAGMLQALGLRLTRVDGAEVGRGGAALADVANVDVAGLDRRLDIGRKAGAGVAGVADVAGDSDGSGGAVVLVASDVENPLLGPRGAAAVFGPQKGASPADVEVLEVALSRWAAVTKSATGRDLAEAPGAGAAGGTGFGALAYLNARLVPGVELVLDLIGFDAAATGADLVITGEGSLDPQTLGGKAPVGVARSASRRGVPVVAVAGQVRLSDAEIRDAGFAAAYSLSELEPDPAVSMARAPELLALIGHQIAKTHIPSS